MTKKTIAELLQEAKQLRNQERELKARMKAQKSILITEYQDNLSPEVKQTQIADAEKILNSVKANCERLTTEYKIAIRKEKDKALFAKEILDFVNYKANHSLPKRKQSFAFTADKKLHYLRDGIKEIVIDISKANWKAVFKQELAKQGIDGDNRIADNVVWTAGIKLAEEIANGKIKI